MYEWVEVNTEDPNSGGNHRFQTQEYVFEKILRDGNGWPKWSVRVYTSVDKRDPNGLSRGCGEDAIRFVLFDLVSHKPCGKTKRVNRTGDKGSLSDRFLNRYEAVLAQIPCEESERCNECGAATVERENHRTKHKFRGCLNYPNCKGPKREVKPKTQSILNVQADVEVCPF